MLRQLSHNSHYVNFLEVRHEYYQLCEVAQYLYFSVDKCKRQVLNARGSHVHLNSKPFAHMSHLF